jgi:hypothetical protein
MTPLTILGVLAIAACVALTWHAASIAAPAGGQTRVESLKEAWTNIVIGFSINYFANLLIFPLVGMHIGLDQNFWIGCIYTAISLVRQFVIRRRFNARTVRQQEATNA